MRRAAAWLVVLAWAYAVHSEHMCAPGADAPVRVVSCGEPDTCVDIVVLAEGYAVEQRQQFIQDVERTATQALTHPHSAFMAFSPLINVWAQFVPSRTAGARSRRHCTARAANAA